MRGVIEKDDGFVAIVRGADNRTYTVRAGEQLHDGTVRAVTADAMFILQDVHDPLSTRRSGRSRNYFDRRRGAQ